MPSHLRRRRRNLRPARPPSAGRTVLRAAEAFVQGAALFLEDLLERFWYILEGRREVVLVELLAALLT